MKVNVEKLYESVKKSGITLLAGRQGLNRTVRWVHITESEEICSFLKGEEVVLITGVALSEVNELIALVKSAIRCGTSGIIINIGPYIKEIDPRIIELCEQRQVPLFSVPWKVYIAEIIQKFCLIITLEDKKEVELSAAIKNAILFPGQSELYEPYLKNYGIGINNEYTVMVITLENDNKEKLDINIKMLIKQIEAYSYNMNWSSFTIRMDNDILILFDGKFDEEKIDNCFNQLMNDCTSIKLNKYIYCGIGEKSNNIMEIYKSYNQCKNVISIQKLHSELIITNRYSELGIYKLLLKVSDKDIMHSFVDDNIGDVLKYDKINNSNLEEVLRVYLKNNGSVKDTADNLFIHRNTVNYKINKINKILNINLSDYESCSKVLVALKIYDILAI